MISTPDHRREKEHVCTASRVLRPTSHALGVRDDLPSPSDRLYPIRRPLAAFLGAAVAVLGGLIGLGGAEFRLPLLIAVFELFPHRAIRINLLISLATFAVAAIARQTFTSAASITDFKVEIVAMIAGGVIATWIGAARIPKHRVLAVIAFLLIAISGLLVFETYYADSTALALPRDA